MRYTRRGHEVVWEQPLPDNIYQPVHVIRERRVMPLTQAGITYEGFENSGGLEKISLFGLTESIDQQVETLDSGLDFHVPRRELRITRSHNRRLKGALNPPRSNCQTYSTDSECGRKLGGDGPGEEGGGLSGVREECEPRVSLFGVVELFPRKNAFSASQGPNRSAQGASQRWAGGGWRRFREAMRTRFKERVFLETAEFIQTRTSMGPWRECARAIRVSRAN